MPNPRVSICVFCDDVRQEVGNKISLMGVYAGDIIFPSAPPVTYPRLSIVLWVVSDPGDMPEKVTVTVLAPPDRHEVLRVDVQSLASEIQHAEGATKHRLQAIFSLLPFHVTSEGYFEVFVDTERERIRAGRLKASFASPESQP
jgi:hypothetical protein